MSGLAIIVLIALVSAVILKIGMYFFGELGGVVIAVIIILLMLAATGDSQERYTKHDILSQDCTKIERIVGTICTNDGECVYYIEFSYDCRLVLRKNTATATKRIRRMPTVTKGYNPYEGLTFREQGK